MVRRWAVLLCAFAAACASKRGPIPAAVSQAYGPPALVESFSDPERRAKLATAFPRLEAFLEQQRAAQKLPSLAFGLVIDGQLAYERGLGPRALGGQDQVDGDTVYRIGSVTKTFTGLAVLALRDAGTLALDDPATRFVPELAALRYPTRDAAPITLRQLLTHGSGLPTLGAFTYAQSSHDVTEAELLGGLADVAFVAAPGTRSSYSNFGFGLLGLVVQRASGTRYRDYVTRTILLPLGMTATRWSADDVPPERLATAYQHTPAGPRAVTPWRLGAFEGAGGLYSSVHDLARYVAFQLGAYPPRDEPEAGPVRRSTVREAHAWQRMDELAVTVRRGAAGTPAIDASVIGVGLAWQERQTCELEQIVGHHGATEGHSAAVRLLPQRGVGLIALSNLQDAELRAVTIGASELLEATGGLSLRTLPASPLLARALRRSVALYNDFREADYDDLFAPSFRAALPASRIVELVSELKPVQGRCQAEPIAPLVIESPQSGTFAVPCEHGWLQWHIVTAADGRIVESTVERRAEGTPVTPSGARCREAPPVAVPPRG